MKESLSLTCTRKEFYDYERAMLEGLTFDIMGKKYIISGYDLIQSNLHHANVELFLHPYHEMKPKPKSEAELQFEQAIKLTEQDIEHKKRLIEQYEAKRAGLEKQRLGN